MAAVTECPSCGAADQTAEAPCASCGAAPLPEEPGDGRVGVPAGSPPEAIPDDLPPAQEARRVRGPAVLLVAALVVAGIGYPLTALAVSQVGRLPAPTPTAPGVLSGADFGGPTSGPRGRARLGGAIVYNGPAMPLGCMGGAPRLVTLGSGDEGYTILLSVPAGGGPGTYPLEGTTTTFVAVTHQGGTSQSWTSLRRPGARGTVTVGADKSVAARFTGLDASGGGAMGIVEGSVEVRCE